MDYVIFAIDNNTDVHTVAKFMRLIDTKRVMGEMSGDMVQCIGNWEGILETSYIMRKDDYTSIVLPAGYTNEQEAVMIAPSSRNQPATIWAADLSEMFTALNRVREITAEEATPDVAWTFNMTTGKYFTA